MKKELKSGILSADKSADCRPTVGGVNVIAVFVFAYAKSQLSHDAAQYSEDFCFLLGFAYFIIIVPAIYA